MITIKQARQIREALGLTHLVIFGVTADDHQHVATHGKSRIHAKEAARAGNNLKTSLDWPAEFCNSKPLERICGKCDFWQRGYHRPGEPIPEKWSGCCMHEPNKVQRYDTDIACSQFDPCL